MGMLRTTRVLGSLHPTDIDVGFPQLPVLGVAEAEADARRVVIEAQYNDFLISALPPTALNIRTISYFDRVGKRNVILTKR